VLPRGGRCTSLGLYSRRLSYRNDCAATPALFRVAAVGRGIAPRGKHFRRTRATNDKSLHIDRSGIGGCSVVTWTCSCSRPIAPRDSDSAPGFSLRMISKAGECLPVLLATPDYKGPSQSPPRRPSAAASRSRPWFQIVGKRDSAEIVANGALRARQRQHRCNPGSTTTSRDLHSAGRSHCLEDRGGHSKYTWIAARSDHHSATRLSRSIAASARASSTRLSLCEDVALHGARDVQDRIVA